MSTTIGTPVTRPSLGWCYVFLPADAVLQEGDLIRWPKIAGYEDWRKVQTGGIMSNWIGLPLRDYQRVQTHNFDIEVIRKLKPMFLTEGTN